MVLAKHAAAHKKTFALNLSAPFIPQFFKSQLDQILPYVSILVGNDAEFEVYATSNGLDPKDLPSVALKVASLPSENPSIPRLVVITGGTSPTILASAKTQETKSYPVDALPESKIVDTNGAGDAFAGAFLGALISGKSVDQAVEAGHKLGQICVQQVGPTFQWPKVDIL